MGSATPGSQGCTGAGQSSMPSDYVRITTLIPFLVQVGNIFSGLFLSVKGIDPAVRPITTVQPPEWSSMQAVSKQDGSADLTAASISKQHHTRRWEDSPYLAARLAASQKQVKVIPWMDA